MAKIKKNTTYYVGRPVKEGKVFAQSVAYVDANGKITNGVTYSSKASDFANGFMGFGISVRAINISKKEFDKLKL